MAFLRRASARGRTPVRALSGRGLLIRAGVWGGAVWLLTQKGNSPTAPHVPLPHNHTFQRGQQVMLTQDITEPLPLKRGQIFTVDATGLDGQNRPIIVVKWNHQQLYLLTAYLEPYKGVPSALNGHSPQANGR